MLRSHTRIFLRVHTCRTNP